MTLPIALHVLAAIVWVGGMVFVMMAFRPAAEALEPPVRLPLVRAMLANFFRWVWASIALLLATGYWMILGPLGGFGSVGLHIHLMHGVGWVMVLLYLYLYFVPWRRMGQALAAGELPTAARHLGAIRCMVWTNMGLGLAVAVIGATGRYWG